MKKQYQSDQLLATHLKLKTVAKTIVTLIIIIFIGIALLPWMQTIDGVGKVVALSPNDREQNVIAPISGRLGQWYVHDGSHVKKGDPIVVVNDIDPQLLTRLKSEREAILMRIETTQQAINTSKLNVDRQKKLFDQGISSRRRYEESRFEYLKFRNDLAKDKIALANIDTKIARQQNQLVKATQPGTIIHRIAGQDNVLVKQGARLAVLVPETKSRAVTLWIKGNDIPLIKKGQPVRLQFEGWPAIQFSGWPSVAVGTFGGHVELVDPIDNGKGQFRILVVANKEGAWPNANFLRQGVRVKGWVLLSEVHLWYELWRRANGFPPAIQTNSTFLHKAS